jgi:hypothetical protein
MPVTYEPIASTTLGAAAADITFSSIPDTYTDLVLVSVLRSTKTSTANDVIYVQLNGDTGSNYSQTFLFGNGSTAGSSRASNGTYIYAADIVTSNSSYTGLSTVIFNINNYSNATTNKTLLSRVSSPNTFSEAVVGLYRSTNKVSSIKLYTATDQYVSGSIFTLYGIKSA